MGRTTAILLAGAMLALSGAGAASASPACRCAPATSANDEVQAVAGRAHLVYRTTDRHAAFEGEVTFLQRAPTLETSRGRLDPAAIAAEASADAAPAAPTAADRETSALSAPMAG